MSYEFLSCTMVIMEKPQQENEGTPRELEEIERQELGELVRKLRNEGK